MDPARQFEAIEDETGLCFLCLNSAWRVDQFRPERAELNNDALGSALMQTGKVKLGILGVASCGGGGSEGGGYGCDGAAGSERVPRAAAWGRA